MLTLLQESNSDYEDTLSSVTTSDGMPDGQDILGTQGPLRPSPNNAAHTHSQVPCAVLITEALTRPVAHVHTPKSTPGAPCVHKMFVTVAASPPLIVPPPAVSFPRHGRPRTPPGLNILALHCTYQYALSCDEQRGFFNGAPFDASNLRKKNPVVSGPTIDAARRAFNAAPWATSSRPAVLAPVWVTTGPLAGTYELVRIPVRRRAPVALPEPRRMTAPVFPKGIEEDVIAAANSCGTFYVVNKGFRVGVYTTYDYGAREATDNCPNLSHISYKCEYHVACRIFMEAMKSHSVKTVLFTGPNGP
jgi:hypothetical protein